MRRVLLALLVVCSSAAADDLAQSPAVLSRAGDVVQRQRNAAMNALAVTEAHRDILAEENAKLRERVEMLTKELAEARAQHQ